jgi:anion-transporting  ArsA/GET3 family ATPase
MAMNWLRSRLRKWLGIEDLAKLSAGMLGDIVPKQSILQLEERNRLAWDRIVALEQQHSEISSKQNELKAIMAEVRQLRELLTDPKRVPVVTKTTHQFRALMEQEI